MPSDSEYLEMAGINDQGEKASEPAAPTETAPAAPIETFDLNGNKFPVTTEFSFIHDGKPHKTPYKDLVNGYRRATHFQQKWENEGLKKIQEYEQKLQPFDQYKGFYDKYNALQTWSEQNPQDWARLEEIWKNKDQHLLAAKAGNQIDPQALNPIVQELAQLKSQLSEFGSMKQKLESQEQEKAQQEQIGQIKNEIVEFQKEFKEIDLEEKDPDGLALWAKIVQWGNSKGYVDFSSAATMYLKPRIAEIYGLRSRQEAMKSVKTDHQNGIVKRSAIPLQTGSGTEQPQNIRKLSYGDLAERAKSGLLASEG